MLGTYIELGTQQLEDYFQVHIEHLQKFLLPFNLYLLSVFHIKDPSM